MTKWLPRLRRKGVGGGGGGGGDCSGGAQNTNQIWPSRAYLGGGVWLDSPHSKVKNVLELRTYVQYEEEMHIGNSWVSL